MSIHLRPSLAARQGIETAGRAEEPAVVQAEILIKIPTGTIPQILRVVPHDGTRAVIARMRVELLQRMPRPMIDRTRREKGVECATCTPPPTILLSA